MRALPVCAAALLVALAGAAGAGDAPQVAPDGSTSITVELAKPQYVTVVIEDATGKRVRNLISETRLPAGRNRITWDGYDDGVVTDGDLVQKRAEAGAYRARGLVHDGIRTFYEFSAYSGGNLPWPTKDNMGAWMADHSSPLGATFIPAGSPYGDGRPQVLLTALVAEAGAPTVWVDTDSKVVQRRSPWGWDGGEAAATDFGKDRDPRFYAYVLKCMGNDDGVTIRALATTSAPDIATYRPKVKMPREPRELGLALSIRDGLAVCAVPLDDAVVFIDIKLGKVLGTAAVKAPKGVLLDDRGRLLVSTEGTVKRFGVSRPTPDAVPQLDAGQVLISGLEDPRTIQTDLQGKELYVADWGASHQVKVYSADGKPARTIGKPGGFQIGRYDELRMHAPCGLAIDDKGQLWIAEADWLPKRISIWDAGSGRFKRAHYGPPHYGGGGTIDPQDKTRFFYGEFGGTLEFKLDWEKGTSTLVAVPIRTWNVPRRFDEMSGHTFGAYGPEVAYRANGRLYLSLGYQAPHRVNESCAYWLYDDGTRTARPVAYVGSQRYWKALSDQPWFKELAERGGIYEPFLAWTDLDGDGRFSKDEFQVHRFDETVPKGDGRRTNLFGFRRFTPAADLSLSGSWNLQVPAPTFRPDGAPQYDISKATFAIPPGPDQHWNEDGHDGLRLSDGSWLQGFKAWKDGRWIWSYPTSWEHWTPPRFPGDVTEPTRIMGPPFNPAGSEATDVLCWNGERGNMFLLTGDGLYIQTIGGHRVVDELLRPAKAERNMEVTGLSFEDEHFHPTITCTKDGEVYMVAGKEHSSIFRLDGFASVRKRSFGGFTLAAPAVARLAPTRTTPGRKQGRLNGTIALMAKAPVVDGKLEEWGADGWLDIGTAGKGRIAIAGDRVYLAYQLATADLLANDAVTDPLFAFKRGSSVDLMIGSGKRANLAPQAGDQRLLACMVKGRPLAVLFRQVAPAGGRLGKPMLYESPIGTVQFDDVGVVSEQIRMAVVGTSVELSAPLSLLGLDGRIGAGYIGDLGILRGNGVQTLQRSYWNNLDTAMVSDIPTEAKLAPARWGNLKVVRAVDPTPLAAKPVDAKTLQPGLLRRLWNSRAERVPQQELPDPVSSEVSAGVDLKGVPAREDYALWFDGWLAVPKTGVYGFTLTSDDGSLLWIDGQLVVDNDGMHGPQPVSDGISLAEGLHAIRVGFLQRGGGASLALSWTMPGSSEKEIPASAFRH